MQSRIIQIAGFAFTIAYAVFIVWLYATEPRVPRGGTSAEVAAGTLWNNQFSSFDPSLDNLQMSP